MSFSISKQQLSSMVQNLQKRTFAQQLQLFESKRVPLQWLSSGLNTNFQYGIFGDQDDINQRSFFYGTNHKPLKQIPTFFLLFCQALEDFTLRILIIASIITIIVQTTTAPSDMRSTSWIEGFSILLAVFICASVTAINDYQKERQFMKLNKQKQKKKIITVYRNGIMNQIHQDLLLVGDVINVSAGMQVPADGFLIQSNQIICDQSSMTGETKPIKKNILSKCLLQKQQIILNSLKNKVDHNQISSPIMLSGTSILTGQGKMVIIAVGDFSCLGKIRSVLIQDQDGPTPLQNKLEKIAEDIGKFGLYSAILILILLLIRFGIQKGVSRTWNTSQDIKQLLSYLVLALTVVVVAIPQGLPLAVTLSLAFSVKKMLNDNNLVRKLQACQTMGGANNICSDKTGTLTKNQMTVTTFWNDQITQFKPYEQYIQISNYFPNKNFQQFFKISSTINTTSYLKTKQTNQKGSATQLAILKLFTKMNFNYLQFRNKYPIIKKFPFNSQRKRMSTLLQFQGKDILLTKGASEIVLNTCSKWMNCTNGTISTLNQITLKKIKKSIQTMGKKSLRTLCLAYKDYDPNQNIEIADTKGVYQIQKSNLTLLCIIGIKDIPRPEVPQAIRKCKKAGITVRMVTGDNLITAKAIAQQIGIISVDDTQHLILQGRQFIQRIGGVVCKKCRKQKCPCPINIQQAQSNNLKQQDVRIDTILNSQTFDKISDKLLVLARSRPQDKYALVTGLKQRGNIVAVTGDGTNDASALKKADVGFAMGINGTQVAKEASAIILLDDNFQSIVKAVMWGRNIYDSIRKFIQFQLTVNLVAVGLTLVGAALLKQQILRPIQMLWLNLIMDTLGSLALATQSPTQILLQRQPHQRDDYIISKTMFKNIIGQAIFQFIVLIFLVFYGEHLLKQYQDDFDLINGFQRYYKYDAWGMARSGRMIKINGDDDYQSIYNKTYVYPRHITFVFNTFVMMQIFNFFNSRKINNQFNICSNITNNPIFIIIVITIFLLQVILVTFAGSAFGVYPFFGLQPVHWIISVAIGFIGIPIGILLKLIPQKIFPEKGNKQANFTNPSSKAIKMRRRSLRASRQINYNNQQ